MNAAIISLGSISSKWVAEELKKYFEQVDMLDIKEIEVCLGGKGKGEIFYKGQPLPEYDCIYAKGSFRYGNLLRSITTFLANGCYFPVSADAHTTGHDKILTHIKLQGTIPMPKTYIASTAESAKKILKKIQYPIVMKLPSGTHGKGVMLADSYESASSMVDALALLKQPFLLQEYIETDGTDIRAIVVGNEVAAAMQRTAVKGEKRANIHAGGKGTPVTLDAKTKKIAVQTAKLMGADICAIDILPSVRGPMVLEVNLSPGLQGITKATKTNVAAKLAKFLAEKTKERKEAFAKTFEEKAIKEVLPGQEIVTKLDFRGERILLPKIVSELTQFKEEKDVVMKAKKGKLEIEESE
ncbi:MAG: RimK family alpha-L-glutamate ligase [Candidatus Woesearchaeota archaeon]